MSAAAVAAVDAHLARSGAPAEWGMPAARRNRRARCPRRAGRPGTDGARALLGELRRVAIAAERGELIRLWRENEIGDEVMRHQEELLDYQEAQL
jgi:hypothetical protein